MRNAQPTEVAPRPVYTPCPVPDCQDADCEHISPLACDACAVPLNEDESRLARLNAGHSPVCDECFWGSVECSQLARDLVVYADLRRADFEPGEAIQAFASRRAS
jgi:hypothetical protein